MPKVMVEFADRVDVAALAGRHRSHRPATDTSDDLDREHLRGPDVRLHHLDRPSDVCGVDAVSRFELRDQLVENPPDAVRVRAVDRDLVAAHVDRRVVELALDQEEELIAFAEKADHELIPGDVDFELRRGHRDRFEGISEVRYSSTLSCPRSTSQPQPGGQIIWRPPRTWRWRWGIEFCACRPTFRTSR